MYLTPKVQLLNTYLSKLSSYNPGFKATSSLPQESMPQKLQILQKFSSQKLEILFPKYIHKFDCCLPKKKHRPLNLQILVTKIKLLEATDIILYNLLLIVYKYLPQGYCFLQILFSENHGPESYWYLPQKFRLQMLMIIPSIICPLQILAPKNLGP